ncbi:hypothetical protein T439DRAFT_325230 [Meredithblackwellia eburnea MCA 4105]
MDTLWRKEEYEGDDTRAALLNQTGLYQNALWADEDSEEEEPSYWYQKTGKEKPTDPGERRKQAEEAQAFPVSCPIWAPSIASQRASQAFSQHSFGKAPNGTTFMSRFVEEESQDFSQLDTPPQFSWEPCSITSIDQIRGIVKNERTYGGRARVSVLAIVNDINPPTETKSGKRKAELVLIDKSWAPFKVVLWDQVGKDWCESVQRGDVIYVGNIGVKFYQDKIQGTPDARHSCLQVCYRTNLLSKEADMINFHRAHAETSETAKIIIELIDWYQGTFLRKAR